MVEIFQYPVEKNFNTPSHRSAPQRTASHRIAMSKPVVCIVAALLPQMGIGYRGGLPWRLRKEMQYFRQVTASTFDPAACNAVVMGRRTWESIPPKFRPLRDRINVVLTTACEAPFVRRDHDLYESRDLSTAIAALQDMPHCERIYIIGGAQLYAQARELASHWLVTKIHCHDPPDSVPTDTFLPDLSHCSLQPSHRLAQFLPPAVLLPPLETRGDLDSDPQHYTTEHRFTYWYTLYVLRPA